MSNPSELPAEVRSYIGQFCMFASSMEKSEFGGSTKFYYKKDIKSEQSLDYDYYTVWLSWEDKARSYRIFRENEWIANTTLTQYADKQVRVAKGGTELKYQLIAIDQLFQASEQVSINVTFL